MEKEYPDDLIVVDDGEVFSGTRREFSQKYFDASDNRDLVDWAKQHGYWVTVNGERIRL